MNVRELGSGRALPGAELIYLDGRKDAHTLGFAEVSSGLDLVYLQRMGKRARAGQEGRATLVCRPGGVVVMASAATHWGQAWLEVREGIEEPLLLECVPAVALELRVVNAQGRPVGGAEISLVCQASAAWKEMLGVSEPQWRLRAPERLDAISRLPSGLARFWPVPPSSNSGYSVVIKSAFPGLPAHELRFETPPAEPVDFVLPEHGGLEIRLFDPAGTAISCPGAVKIGCRSMLGGPWTEAIDRDRGVAGFFPMALGLELWVGVSIPGIEAQVGTIASGPRAAGERVVVDVTLPYVPTWFSFRLEDEQREALARRSVAYRLEFERDGRPCLAQGEIFSDDLGRVAFALDGPLAQQCASLLTIRCEAGAGSSAALDRAASRVDGALAQQVAEFQAIQSREIGRDIGSLIPISIRPGRNELKPITLVPMSVIAAGVVVDDKGRRPGASVRLSASGSTGTTGEWALPAECDDQGSFLLTGVCQSAQLRLEFRGSADEAWSFAVIARGDRELELRLPDSDR